MSTRRNLLFGVLLIASIIAFWTPLKTLVGLSRDHDEYTHTVLIPLISLALLYFERQKIFVKPRYSLGIGGLVLLSEILMNWLTLQYSALLGQDIFLFWRILSLVTFWIGGFILCYGTHTFRAGAFALLFVLLMVPLPGFVMETPITIIRHGSAEVAYAFFKLAGVPVFRDGWAFSLPGLNMEISQNCSGIHSSIALFLFSLIVGHFTLRSGWKKIALSLSVVPIISLTNGFRIFGLSILAAYVDMSFFKGNLHHRGGVLFFTLGLILLTCFVGLLRKTKHEKRGSPGPMSPELLEAKDDSSPSTPPVVPAAIDAS